MSSSTEHLNDMSSPDSSRMSEDTTTAHSSPHVKDIISFLPNDAENPRNWPEWRKWSIVVAITLVDLSVSWGASGFSPASKKFTQDFQVSTEVGVLLPPLSEYFGRSLLYIIPYGCYLCFLVGTALVQNLGGFLVLRILSGLFASVTIANFGGTIADMWPRDQVGPAMSGFLWAAVCGSPSGYFLFSFVAATRPWRTVIWAILGVCGGFWLILCVVLLGFKNETRHSVLLRRRAANIKQDRQTSNVDVPEEMRQKSLSQLFRVTLSRPFRFLFTEAIIIFAALYNGYLYGLSFLFNDAFNLVFGTEGKGFGVIGVGLTFLGLAIGITLGPVVNIWQERYYQRRIREGRSRSADDRLEASKDDRFANIPEARVQLGKIAAITFPISLSWFAWTTPTEYHIHWIVPVLATVLFGWSFYALILMTYLYIEDSYMVFSASALAGVGLIRNLAGAGFPLFGNQLFQNEGYNWAGTILACLAMLLIPIPFVLERYGTKLRSRSPWARQHMDGNDIDRHEDD